MHQEQHNFEKNGWYFESCGISPKQLGSVSETDAARIALFLINNLKIYK